MSRYGTVLVPANALTEFLESADPVDMQTRANAAIAAIAAAEPTRVITAIDLAGAGKGHTFVMMIEHAPIVNVTGGLGPSLTTIACYMAAQSEALDVARGAVVFAGGTSIDDELLAGASKGTRWMGAVVRGSQVLPLVLVAMGLMGKEDGGITVNGSGVLTTGMANGGGAVQFAVPAAGSLQYTGTRPGLFILDGVISLSMATEFVGEAKIVSDPLGTPTEIVLPTDFTMIADVTLAVRMHTVATLAPLATVGLQLTGLGAGTPTVASAHLRAVQIR